MGVEFMSHTLKGFSNDQINVFAHHLVVVLEDPDKGVWGGPQTNTRDDGLVALAFGHIVLVFTMARTFLGILEHNVFSQLHFVAIISA